MKKIISMIMLIVSVFATTFPFLFILISVKIQDILQHIICLEKEMLQ